MSNNSRIPSDIEEAGLSLRRKPQRPMTRVDLIRQGIKQANKWENYV